jgi:UDP-N-acetylglucosamine--N-acetylmuramyl-(pentapeptide) pyrophosphoryl-undecaprenol N-acetylglucosamine transferase
MIIKNSKICLTGGGTGGSVTPLLGLYSHLKAHENLKPYNFLWIGSKNGLEKVLVEKQDIAYFGISAGKLRRYFSLRNFIDPFLIVAGFFQALMILRRERPSVIISAGSFVAVPVIIAGWFLRIPSIVHQMDVRPGLANKLMAPFAKIITTTFEKSLSDYDSRARQVGNIIRPEIKNVPNLSKTDLLKKYGLKPSMPILLVVGGGTGAQAINRLLIENLPALTKTCQIIHQTGAGKERGKADANYFAYDFLTAEQLAECYAMADLVISRAGLGFISELAFLGKPSIIIPMPGTHQEDNARLLEEKGAALILHEKIISNDRFAFRIQDLLGDHDKLAYFAANIRELLKTNAEVELTSILKNLL